MTQSPWTFFQAEIPRDDCHGSFVGVKEPRRQHGDEWVERECFGGTINSLDELGGVHDVGLFVEDLYRKNWKLALGT